MKVFLATHDLYLTQLPAKALRVLLEQLSFGKEQHSSSVTIQVQ